MIMSRTEKLMQSIEEDCRLFKEALSSLDISSLPHPFKNFPQGSCLDTCFILASYLTSRNNISLTCVSGEYMTNNGRITHSWLVYEDWIIDITADQFKNRPSISILKDHTWYTIFTKLSIIDIPDVRSRTNLMLVMGEIDKVLF